MKYKNKFEIEDEPAVPTHLQWAITRSIPHARSCSVVELAQGGRSRKSVNSFKLTLPQGATRPKESVNDIAQAVCNIMQYRWEELAIKAGPDEAGPVKFRVEFACPDSPKTQRPYCDWDWDPSEILGADDVEMRNIETTVLRDLMDTQTAMIDRLLYQQNDTQERFLKLAELNAEPIKQTGEQLGFANALSLQGMTALVEATRMTYSYEATKALEQQRTERWKMVFDKIGPGASLAFGQLASYVGGKITGKPVTIPRGGVPDPGAQPPNEPRRPTNGAAHPPAPPSGGVEYSAPEPDAEEEEEEIDADDAEEMTDPLASFAQAFGENLTNQQRRELRKLMKSEHFAVFEDMFCSEDDDEAIKNYQRLGNEVPAQALIQLAMLLDEDQGQDFETFRKLMDKAVTERSAQPEGAEDEKDDN